jgi:hypothetical protein
MVESDRSGSGESSSKSLGAGAIASLTGLGPCSSSSPEHRGRQVDFLFLSFAWPLWLYTIVVALIRALVWFGLGDASPDAARNVALTRRDA